jgi:uncharacterized membrane protein
MHGRERMKIRETQIWFVVGIIVVALLLFWVGAVVYAYVADDLSATPADERSMPPPRSY